MLLFIAGQEGDEQNAVINMQTYISRNKKYWDMWKTAGIEKIWMFKINATTTKALQSMAHLKQSQMVNLNSVWFMNLEYQ